jgi:hypothetical protein
VQLRFKAFAPTAKRHVGVALLLFLGPALAHAQNASVTGTIRDSSGGTVQGAAVSALEPQRAISRDAVTNENGEYLIAGLPPGSYTVSVQASGFEQYRVTDLVVRATEKVRADAALVPGRITSEINVAGNDVAPVELESSELSGSITHK